MSPAAILLNAGWRYEVLDGPVLVAALPLEDNEIFSNAAFVNAALSELTMLYPAINKIEVDYPYVEGMNYVLKLVIY